MPILDPMDNEVFINTLTELARAKGISKDDPEEGHRLADRVVLSILEHIGLPEHARMYKEVKKFYA